MVGYLDGAQFFMIINGTVMTAFEHSTFPCSSFHGDIFLCGITRLKGGGIPKCLLQTGKLLPGKRGVFTVPLAMRQCTCRPTARIYHLNCVSFRNALQSQ